MSQSSNQQLRKSHGSEVLESLYRGYEIGQVSKLPGGNLSIKAKSRKACLLERTSVNILGSEYPIDRNERRGEFK